VHTTETLAEADRLMRICNSCRYCEGLCAVFPAMEMRRAFSDGDLDYLANLCHGCGACYIDCQFAPPHEFNVNVPRVMAKLRAESYGRNARPGLLRGVFARNGLATSAIMAASVLAFAVAFFFVAGWRGLLTPQLGPGAFYRVVPHEVMAALFGTAFALALTALAGGMSKFQRGTAAPALGAQSFWAAFRDAGRLRYLDGGGAGCYSTTNRPDRRRLFHHLTFYGFLFCFASTSVATIYHYGLGLEAPYAWYQLPVLLGVIGGLGLISGPIGLLYEKQAADPGTAEEALRGMDLAFLVSLLLTSVSGFALLFLRTTSLMNLLLALHLGVVFALFITLPYGKFVHGLYRFLALLRYAAERNSARHGVSE
jgi:citrate/tricarballylate utilization protein